MGHEGIGWTAVSCALIEVASSAQASGCGADVFRNIYLQHPARRIDSFQPCFSQALRYRIDKPLPRALVFTRMQHTFAQRREMRCVSSRCGQFPCSRSRQAPKDRLDRYTVHCVGTGNMRKARGMGLHERGSIPTAGRSGTDCALQT
ncbi:uncharacterized protein CC84DRAFT_202300 [Paraphaeosphaeria sporulosa]|uniref:Uncharacterized protein n=1 Tax=Paraphaeosphaeria sporulosa TaxID=1460663 RepID=A0A177C485_9PLEO|nr:uncharacterized protein CC84DRAFT_202300 [Paraphaeosphaeria sporulosa]OAG01608.1 hypothetical protein CC84DRAFT_202300 [Paraphaeosphaeria sporulosa]